MSDYYNLTNATANPSIQGLLQYGNAITDGILGHGLVFAVWAVVFLITKSTLDTGRAISTASFISFLIGFILYLGGMFSWQALFLLLGVTILSTAFVRG